MVYHYTSMDVLLKIVEKREFWATNARFLNDVSERDHFLSLVERQLVHMAGREGALPTIRSLCDGFAKYAKEHRRFTELPYVVSFSAEPDSLAQWRAYCARGNGVCIGIRTDSLRQAAVKAVDGRSLTDEPLSVDPEVAFQRVLYLSAEDQAQIIKMILSEIERVNFLFAVHKWHTFMSAQDELSTRFNDLLERRAASCKNPAFSAEAEYRLIATATDAPEKVLRYRSAKTSIVPYLAISAEDPTDFLKTGDRLRKTDQGFLECTPYFIESVMIGPNPNGDLSAEVLNTMFEGQRSNVKISRSNIPYRDWL
ncbi:Protein of unknown function [Terriglobus roseus]|uniref:DUF2971 domain-containing protein n=1 Tax=Terriglobus roseus TaxID=392734 RepID=A0A1H4J5E3_9BACT|nr:Protein of unknown function [Terriglobus roseus]